MPRVLCFPQPYFQPPVLRERRPAERIHKIIKADQSQASVLPARRRQSFRWFIMSAEEHAETINMCINELEMINNDTSVPRNIRKSVTEIIEILKKDDKPLFLRTTRSLSILSEVSSDPNLPMHTGTLIWSILGKLETIPPEDI